MSYNGFLRRVSKTPSVMVGIFVLFSDDALQWYTALPWQLNYSIAAIASALIAGLAIAFRRWPTRLQSYREGTMEVFEQVGDSLRYFVAAGLVRIFYELDIVLISIYWHWATWVLFGVQAWILHNVWTMKEPSSIEERTLRFLWNQIRKQRPAVRGF